MLVTNELIDFVREQFEAALLATQPAPDGSNLPTDGRARARTVAAEWAAILNVLEQQPQRVDELPPRQCM